MEYEPGNIVICTVEKIQGTTVFVNVEGKKEGYIVLSEIAPGRIRNLRDYVVPKKTIVCKILRISGERLELSLRRVTQKEQKQAKEQYKLEKSYNSIIKTVLKENCEVALKQIGDEKTIIEFLEESKENPRKLQKICGLENSKRILKILNSQKLKTSIVKKEITIRTKEAEGIKLIKEILTKIKDAEVKYISAGKYSIKVESKDAKKADQKIKEIIAQIENYSKGKNIEVSK